MVGELGPFAGIAGVVGGLFCAASGWAHLSHTASCCAITHESYVAGRMQGSRVCRGWPWLWAHLVATVAISSCNTNPLQGPALLLLAPRAAPQFTDEPPRPPTNGPSPPFAVAQEAPARSFPPKVRTNEKRVCLRELANHHCCPGRGRDPRAVRANGHPAAGGRRANQDTQCGDARRQLGACRRTEKRLKRLVARG